jgi:hypothetical protein
VRHYSQLQLDDILATLAVQLPASANVLLDLRQWILTSQSAGACIRAYFELLEAAKDRSCATESLNILRRWLESHLEISVIDGVYGSFLETIPFHLEGHDALLQFCQSAMEGWHQDRCHTASRLHMEFRFARNFPLAA